MSRPPDVSSAQGTVVIVSDDPQYGKLLKYGLDLSGLTSVLVESVDESVRVIKDVTPDALILDISMAVTDGLQLLHTLREDARGELPILVLSSSDDRAFSVESLVAGAQDVVVKPAPFPAILERIRKLMEPVPVKETGAGNPPS